MSEELLFGKYRIMKLLANGSGGEVFLAEHTILGERRVIKRLLKNRPFYEQRREEAHTLKLLHHAAIPRIHDIEEDDTACYIIEEDMGGETLFDFLSRQKCLPTSFISHYSIQLCEIIEYLHRNNILYLDIKPENLMICGDKLSLIDFGGAIRKEECKRVLFGTQGYAAPEQYRGMAEERSDVYGIGCVIGTMMGVGNKERKGLSRIYERCVQPIPAKRYNDVAAVKADLQRLQTEGQKKRTVKRKLRPRCIGVVAVHEGAESGVLCTLLAGYFSEGKSGRVACIDLSASLCFGLLYESFFGKEKTVPENFVLQGVCYYPEGNVSAISACMAKGYTTVILNFGALPEHYREEFLRCDSRFVLGSLYPWRLQQWEELFLRISEPELLHTLTAVITGGERDLLPVSVRRVIELPPVKDVLYVERKTGKLFQKVF